MDQETERSPRKTRVLESGTRKGSTSTFGNEMDAPLVYSITFDELRIFNSLKKISPRLNSKLNSY